MKNIKSHDAIPICWMNMISAKAFAANMSSAALPGGSNVVVLSPDVAKVFPDSDSVNEALCTLAKIVNQRAKKLAV